MGNKDPLETGASIIVLFIFSLKSFHMYIILGSREAMFIINPLWFIRRNGKLPGETAVNSFSSSWH